MRFRRITSSWVVSARLRRAPPPQIRSRHIAVGRFVRAPQLRHRNVRVVPRRHVRGGRRAAAELHRVTLCRLVPGGIEAFEAFDPERTRVDRRYKSIVRDLSSWFDSAWFVSGHTGSREVR